MNVLFADAFSVYGATASESDTRTRLIQGGWFPGANGFVSLVATGISGSAISVTASIAQTLSTPIFGPTAEICVSIPIFFAAGFSGAGSMNLQLRNNATVLATFVVASTTGLPSLYLGTTSGTLIGTAAQMPQNEWVYAQIHFLTDATNGFLRLRLNNRLVIDSGLINTGVLQTETFLFNHIQATGANTSYDHVLVTDELVPAQNMDTLLPASDSSPMDWTRFPASTTHFSKVNETPSNGDTTYIESATDGDEATFGLSSYSPQQDAVTAVVLKGVARNSGVADARLLCSIEVATDVASGTEKVIGTAYPGNTTLQEPFYVSPDTMLPFTVAEVNSMLIRLARVDP